jgi:hypothetical protein
MGKRVNAAQHANDAARLEKRLAAFEMKKRGMSLRAIGAELSVNHQTVANYIQETLDEYLIPAAESYRKQLLAEIDDQLERLRELNSKPQYVVNQKGYVLDPQGKPMLDREYHLKVEDRISRLMDQRAKLVGAYAPQQAEVQVTEVTQADLAIADLIAAQKARNDLSRQELETARGGAPSSNPPGG